MAVRAIGSVARRVFSRVVGSGEYHIKANSLVQGAAQVPNMHTNGDCVVVSHREYLGDIQVNNTPRYYQFNLDPTNADTFPWLNQMADLYQEYRFRGLVVTYNPTSGSAISSTSSALGSVSIGTQYNIARPIYITKLELLNSYFATSGAPNLQQIHPVECAPLEQPCQVYFTKQKTSDIAFPDDRFETFARVMLITQGSQVPFGSSNVTGEVWISYEIEFYKPKIHEGAGGQFPAPEAKPSRLVNSAAAAASEFESVPRPLLTRESTLSQFDPDYQEFLSARRR